MIQILDCYVFSENVPIITRIHKLFIATAVIVTERKQLLCIDVYSSMTLIKILLSPIRENIVFHFSFHTNFYLDFELLQNFS